MLKKIIKKKLKKSSLDVIKKFLIPILEKHI